MASQTDKARGQTKCAVEMSPEVVDAASGTTVQTTVWCSPPCDLRGHTVVIKDEAGTDHARLKMSEFDGAANRTHEFLLKVPVRPGSYTWMAVCPAIVKQGVSYPEASAPILFAVKPHTTDILTWDTPPALLAGERFRMKVGIKCSSDCDLRSRDFEIYDHDRKQVAAATLIGERVSGTTGLYATEVELQAPAREGLHEWSIKVAGSDAGIPHREASTSFGVRVVGHPEYLVKVEAVDRDTQTPLSNARVVMHPYQAITNERGEAELRVTRGAYQLFVTQTNYVTFGLPVEVTADETVKAELELEPVPERN